MLQTKIFHPPDNRKAADSELTAGQNACHPSYCKETSSTLWLGMEAFLGMGNGARKSTQGDTQGPKPPPAALAASPGDRAERRRAGPGRAGALGPRCPASSQGAACGRAGSGAEVPLTARPGQRGERPRGAAAAAEALPRDAPTGRGCPAAAATPPDDERRGLGRTARYLKERGRPAAVGEQDEVGAGARLQRQEAAAELDAAAGAQPAQREALAQRRHVREPPPLAGLGVLRRAAAGKALRMRSCPWGPGRRKGPQPIGGCRRCPAGRWAPRRVSGRAPAASPEGAGRHRAAYRALRARWSQRSAISSSEQRHRAGRPAAPGPPAAAASPARPGPSRAIATPRGVTGATRRGQERRGSRRLASAPSSVAGFNGPLKRVSVECLGFVRSRRRNLFLHEHDPAPPIVIAAGWGSGV